MTSLERSLAIAIGVWAVFERPSTPAAASAAPAANGAPRLVVVVSVDQMRADYLERFRPLFAGGLRTLVERGAWFTNARFRHACTETGPGHSVLLSGRSPRSSGIVGNSWYDRTLKRKVNVVEDETVRVLGGQGRAASPSRFVGDTLGDVIKSRSPRSRVVGLSFKDRAAILMAGRRADAAYWCDTDSGRFVTSSHYVEAYPRWLARWNGRALADSFAGRVWERLLPDPRVYREYAGEDEVPGEWDRKDVVFPHLLRGAPPEPGFYEDLRRTPFADTVLLDLAIAAMDAHDLGEDEETDVLAVGFSACDGVGHTYGPDSQEMLDQMLRLDRALGRFLQEVERRAGRDRALVVLTADHGVMPLVEVLQERGLPARRATTDDLHGPVLTALAARFPQARDLIAYPDPLEYVLDASSISRQGLARDEVEKTIETALLDTGLVEAVYSAPELMGPAPSSDPFFELHQRAFYASRSGDLIARLKPYVYLGGYVGGTGHGTPQDYDRHVPLVFMGPTIRPGRHEVACGPEDIAWALARLLAIPYSQQDAATDLLPLLQPDRH